MYGKRIGRAVIVFFCSCTICGCFGFSSGNVEYHGRTSPWKTKTEVRTALGDPVRVSTEENLETWYYLIAPEKTFPGDSSLYGEPKRSTETLTVGAFVFPIWWTTQFTENVKFIFKGESLIDVYELRDAPGSGLICGAVLGHGPQVGCTR